jgi:hypothetical protein
MLGLMIVNWLGAEVGLACSPVTAVVPKWTSCSVSAQPARHVFRHWFVRDLCERHSSGGWRCQTRTLGPMVQAARAEGEIRPLTTMALVPEGRMQKDVQTAEDGRPSVIASLVVQREPGTCFGRRFGVKQRPMGRSLNTHCMHARKSAAVSGSICDGADTGRCFRDRSTCDYAQHWSQAVGGVM